jgi:hypothetical protein
LLANRSPAMGPNCATFSCEFMQTFAENNEYFAACQLADSPSR